MIKAVLVGATIVALVGCTSITSTEKTQSTQETTVMPDIVTSVATPDGGIKYVLNQDGVVQDIIVYADDNGKVEKVRTLQYVNYPEGLTKQTKQGYITVMKSRWEDGKSESIRQFKEQKSIKGVTPFMDFSDANQIMGVDIAVSDIDKQAPITEGTGLSSLLKILVEEPTLTDFEVILVRSGAQRQQ